MSHHCSIVLEFDSFSPADWQKKLLQLVASIHKDACKVTKDTINTVLRALGKQVALKKQGSISLLLTAVKEAEANPIIEECDEDKASKGEVKRESEGEREESEGKSKGEGKKEGEKSAEEESKEEEGEPEEEGKEEKGKEKVHAQLDRKHKCTIQSEEEGEEEEEEEEKTEAAKPHKKWPHVIIDLLQEEIKPVLCTQPNVCDYTMGDTEDQWHHTAQLLAIPESELDMYTMLQFSVHVLFVDNC